MLLPGYAPVPIRVYTNADADADAGIPPASRITLWDCWELCQLLRRCGFLTVRDSACCVVCLHTEVVCVWRCVCVSPPNTLHDIFHGSPPSPAMINGGRPYST